MEMIPGTYSLAHSRARLRGEVRDTLFVYKGDLIIGYLRYSSNTKEVGFFCIYHSTLPLLNFIRPLMDKSTFYLACRISKLKKENEQ